MIILPKAKRSTGVVFFPAFDWAISPDHPEREERLLYTRDQIFEEGIFDIEGYREFNPTPATAADVERVHLVYPTLDQIVSAPHLVSAGGAITAARAVLDGTVERAFAMVRPPGHHATRTVRGIRGFCVINIEAVMIEHVRRHYGVERVAIIDTDCHHGDGTQDVYWNDPDTLFISTHQDGRTIFPGTGFPAEFGGPGGYGATVNIPLPTRTPDAGYHYVIDNLILPILEEFKPDLIINSAGQDNHFSDPLTNMSVTAQGYAEIARKLDAHIAVLEGGYSIQTALPYTNTGILLAMGGVDTSHLVEPGFSPRLREMPDEIDAYFKKLCPLMLQRYRARKELEAAEFGDAPYHETTSSIFYDQLGFGEERVERVKRCPACPSFSTLDTEAGPNSGLFGVQIHRRACPACVAEAHETFERAVDRGKHRLLILQDRTTDMVETIRLK